MGLFNLKETQLILIKGLNYCLISILFLLFALLPSIEIEKLVNPTQTSKFIVFCYIICAIILICSLKFLIDGKFRFTWKKIDVLFIFLFIYITINRYYFQPIHGFSQNYYELIGLAILYYVLRYFVDFNNLKYILIAITIGSIIQALYGNLQLYGFFQTNNPRFKITGSFFNPGPYAGYLSSIFPIALGLYLFKDKNELGYIKYPEFFKSFTGIISLIAIAVILLALAASKSRAAWFAVIGGCLFILIYKNGWITILKLYFNTTFKQLALTIGIIFISIVTITGLYFLNKDSGNGRVLIWKTTMNMINDKPLTGNGFDQFKTNYMDYQANYFKHNLQSNESYLSDDVSFAFNEPIQFVSENGLIGAILFLVTMIFLFKSNDWGNPISIIAIAGLFSILLFSLFSYPSQILPIKLNAIFYSVLIVNTQKTKTFNSTILKFNRYWSGFFKIIITSTIFIYTFFICQYVQRLYKGFEVWQIALTLYQTDFIDSIDHYNMAYPLFNTDGEFLLNYGMVLSMANKPVQAIKILNKASIYKDNTFVQNTLGDSYKAVNEFKDAEISYYKAWYMCPNRFYPKYLLAKVYIQSHQNAKASSIAKELLQQKIKVNSPAIEEMLTEMKALLGKDK